MDSNLSASQPQPVRFRTGTGGALGQHARIVGCAAAVLRQGGVRLARVLALDSGFRKPNVVKEAVVLP